MKTLTIALSLLAAGVQAVEIDPITTRWTFGAHESFMMYRRVGNHCTGGIEGNAKWLGPWLDWWDAHAPEKMEEVGLNFLHSRFYKGMGWDVERRDLPNVKKFVANCHAHGVKALGYVQFATLYPEAMRHEVPDVDDWASLDAKGEPNTYYGPNYFRTMPCIACRAWEDYTKRMCTIALTEAGFDGIMFDNVFEKPCYCKRCEKGFRDYLRRTVRDPAERFGYAAIDDMMLPRVQESKLSAGELKDPIVQAWFEWRREKMNGVLSRLHDHIKSVKADAIVSGNPSPYRMRGMQLSRGEDMVEVARYFDFIIMQTGCAPEVRANGEVVTRIRELKFAQDYGPRIVALCDADAKDFGGGALGFLLPMVEDIVFGGIPTDRTILSPSREPGFVNRERFAFRKPLHAKFNAFAAAHRAELTSPTVRSVRLFYPEREVLYSAKMNQHVLAAEEILIRNRVPFGYLIATPDGVPAIPSGTDVLVLSGLVALSDAQVAAIDAYAKAGGRLVVTGEAGRYDGANAERFEDPLVHLKKLPNVVRREKPDFSGEARYAWTSKIPAPKDGGKALMADLEKAGYRPPVVLEGLPPHVAAEYRSLPDGRLAVHLINYDIRRPVTTGRVVLPEGARASVETPFEADAVRRELPADGTLPPFGLYALLVVGTGN